MGFTLNTSINPLTFQSEQIATDAQQKAFLFKLAQFLSQLQEGAQQAINTLSQNMIVTVSKDLGVLSSNPSVDCTGAGRVFIGLNQNNTNRTLTLNNLAIGTEVMILAKANATSTLKIAANDPSSGAYLVLGYWSGVAGSARVDLTATGWAGTTAGYDVAFMGATVKENGVEVLPLLTLAG